MTRTNLFIFKENLKVILSYSVDQLWNLHTNEDLLLKYSLQHDSPCFDPNFQIDEISEERFSDKSDRANIENELLFKKSNNTVLSNQLRAHFQESLAIKLPKSTETNPVINLKRVIERPIRTEPKEFSKSPLRYARSNISYILSQKKKSLIPHLEHFKNTRMNTYSDSSNLYVSDIITKPSLKKTVTKQSSTLKKLFSKKKLAD